MEEGAKTMEAVAQAESENGVRVGTVQGAVFPERELFDERAGTRRVARGRGRDEEADTESKKINPAQAGRLIGSMLDVFMRGAGEGDPRVRAAALVEELYRLAMSSEDDRVRLAAMKEILDRVDGKVVERKEIKNMKLEGVIYIPKREDNGEER
jgi:hypothetical protein